MKAIASEVPLAKEVHPLQMDRFWANLLRFGAQEGAAFGVGLARAAGMSNTLKLTSGQIDESAILEPSRALALMLLSGALDLLLF